ncbi:hypothetical protein TBLA_0E01910 [Henningerozyma blattae CBS 6284]|uniref:SWIRM domain-containing protein n=1 Tax=Henningerozyma blattae (strain ATCC 34711 / CBS 6284 / DSM 70876 / NBRC 10599 / NRRL Y-10934 / UCD 77-7) TaxID=1071380 RepID=I2H4E3_HENB6|nr:hypothetical protein TBLA_0E01910 [Tetrapisispora blattae CBS 6284]CCH61245.1 hypothetical protein TBLA_0E01910 [Tetrapisispora blattae CBS 6284]
MVLYSPQPDHIELVSSQPQDSIPLSFLKVTDTHGSRGIMPPMPGRSTLFSSPPSPPNSPVVKHWSGKLVNYKTKVSPSLFKLDTPIDKTNQKIVKEINVSLSWDKSQTQRKYRSQHLEFLSQYRMFKGVSTSTHTAPITRTVTKNRRIAQLDSASDFSESTKPSPYRTRRFTKKHSISRSDNDFPISTEPVEHNTPVKRPAKKRQQSSNTNTHHSVIMNLASRDIVLKIPQYIPNVSWNLLPDYSPSLDTLPQNNINCLKIEWKGSATDLTNDPLRSQLHESELVLAQLLRLPCDLYLDSKRRLFLEKYYKVKKGLPFRRTDAQKACRIDVNKASRLYTAFEKVGWLNDRYFINQ